MNTIPRINQPTAEEFWQKFVYPQQPCVITGALDDWKALSLWNLEYLKSKIGHKVVLGRVSENNYFENYPTARSSFSKGCKIKLSTFFDWLQSHHNPPLWQILPPKNPHKSYFVGSLDISSTFPEILPDISTPEYINPKLLISNNLWVGGGENRVNLHYDLYHNLNIPIVGQKHWVIYPPSQTKLLYPHSLLSSYFWCSQVNINNPDFEQFPKFREAKPLEVTINPGEILFLPAFWWHSPIGVGLNIAVNYWWRMELKQMFTTIYHYFLRGSS